MFLLMFVLADRSFRNQNNAQGQEDIITHPLLSNSTGGTGTQSNSNNAARILIEDAYSRRPHGGGLSSWQDFEDIIGGSAVRMLEDLLTTTHSANQNGPLRVDVQSGSDGLLRTFEFDRAPHNHSHRDASSSNNNTNDQVQESLAILHDFQPMSSTERWNQEGRMMYGPNLSDKALKLVNELLNNLVPIAIEDDKKARAEEEKRRQEQRRKDEEERRKAEEEKWRLEKEARKAAEEAAEAAAAEASTSTENNNDEQQVTEQPAAEDTTNAETEAEAERTTVIIHGEPVDITGTGIDIEFLEALPDDLREEVLNQHMRNRPTVVETPEADSISDEFLEALPPDIREEVLHEERERRGRQNRQVPANTPASTTASNTHVISSKQRN